MSSLPDKPAYGPKNPFLAKIASIRPLDCGSEDKKSVHIELELGAQGCAYTCGDCIGVYAQNAPEDVALLLELLGIPADEEVTLPQEAENSSIQKALTEKLYFLARPNSAFIRAVMENTPSARERGNIEALLNGPLEALQQYVRWHNYFDILRLAPSARLGAQELAKALPRIQPRLYSISSSPRFKAGFASLSVSVLKYLKDGQTRSGFASSWLANRAQPGLTPVPAFVARGSVRLPEDPSKDIIMVGPGVGIAPFRAFLQERELTNASGRNWLFYGHRHEATDFYYRKELEEFQARKVLTKLSLAWSRDGEQKRYVQHLMAENAEELWSWLEAGANIYVCGEKENMAREVLDTLSGIAASKGACDDTPESREEWVKAMKKDKRLQMDVY
ncbi:MAG: sulfite reductase subunit alpha [Opitutales bacterium]|nr:sulfite reductase subunit alpha [Opitutales bacterium]